MGLTSLIEFSLQLFDYVNVARRKNLSFLYVSCFQICGVRGALLNRSVLFFLGRRYNYIFVLLLIKPMSRWALGQEYLDFVPIRSLPGYFWSKL